MYMRGISEITHANGAEEKAAARAIVAEGRGLTALYGSDLVIENMTRAFELGDDLHSPSAWPVHAAMLKAMREDASATKSLVDDRLLFETVFGKEK